MRNLHTSDALEGPEFEVVYYESFEVKESLFIVYYESLKRELKTKTTYGYRCDERLRIVSLILLFIMNR